jgi:hypothetical protein
MSAKPRLKKYVRDFDEVRRDLEKTDRYLSASTASNANVSSPPTDAELDAEFGTPAEVGSGFTALIDDGGAATAAYFVAAINSAWWHVSLTKAT